MIKRSGWRVLCVLAVTLMVGSACTREARFNRHVARGDDYIAAGDYDAAELSYRAALQLRGEDPAVLGRIGIMAFRQGRPLSAYFLLQGALKNRPDDHEMQLAYSLACLSLGRTADARLAARRVLDADPTNEDALLAFAGSCLTSRDQMEVRRWIAESQQVHGATPGQHVALGILSVGEGDTAAAMEAFREALKLDPESAAALSHLGSLVLQEGEGEEGRALLAKAASLSPLRSTRRIRYIDHLVQSGAVDEAKRELNEITTAAPDYVPAWSRVMKIAFQEGDLAASDEAAGRVLGRDRMNYEAMMQRVAIKLREGDIDWVIAQLRSVESYYDRSPEVKYQLALAYLKNGQPFEAEQQVRRALRLSETYDEAILLLAELELRRGESAPSIAALTELLERRPDIPRGYVLLAEAYQLRDQSREALAVLLRLEAAYPRVPESSYRVGLAWLALDRKAEARSAFERAIALAPDYWPVQEALIDLDLAEGGGTEAAARAASLLHDYPDATAPRLFQAKVRLLQQEWDKAESDLLAAITADPAASQAYLLLARLYLETDQRERAIEKLNALVSREPNVAVYMQLAVLHQSGGDRAAARATYERILELDGDFVPALNNLAILLSEEPGMLEESHTLATRAYQLAPGDPLVADTLGWILVARRQLEEALPLLRTAAERFPNEARILYHAGVVHYFLTLEEAAGRLLERSRALGLDQKYAQDAAERLAVIAVDPVRSASAERTELERRLERERADAMAWLRLGELDVQAKDFAKAAQYFEEVLRIAPRSVSALVGLVELYSEQLENPDRARELARRARATAPSDGQAAWRLGRQLLRLGDHATAAAWLQDAARYLPDRPEVFFDLARGYFAVGRIQEAETALVECLRVKPAAELGDRARQWQTMLAAARQPGVPHSVQSDAEAVLALTPQHGPALYVVALAREQNGEFSAARTTYQALVGLYPGFAPAWRQLAGLHADHFGDDVMAEECASRALQGLPEDPELAYLLGTIHFRKGDYPEALRWLQQSLKQREAHANAQFFAGLCQYQLKNPNESRIALQRALELELPTREAAEARRILQLVNRGGPSGP